MPCVATAVLPLTTVAAAAAAPPAEGAFDAAEVFGVELEFSPVGVDLVVDVLAVFAPSSGFVSFSGDVFSFAAVSVPVVCLFLSVWLFPVVEADVVSDVLPLVEPEPVLPVLDSGSVVDAVLLVSVLSEAVLPVLLDFAVFEVVSSLEEEVALLVESVPDPVVLWCLR